MASRDGHPVTTSRELWGWYSCGMAAEIFAVCAVGSFLPVTLEQLARENGVLQADGVTPCVKPIIDAALNRLARRDDNQCALYLFGTMVNTSSFAMYTFSMATFFQTLVLISIGAISDYGGMRKQLLLALCFTGASACSLFILVTPGIYLLAVPLTIIGVSCLGASFVLLNSFLPLLAASHPSVSNSIPLQNTDADNNEEDIVESEGLLGNSQLPNNSAQTLVLSNQISSKGIGLGYAISGLVQVISVGIIILYKSTTPTTISSSTLPIRTILLLVGVCWTMLTIPAMLWLHRRPGPALPFAPNLLNSSLVWIQYISFGWMSLWKTIKLALQLRQIIIFLIGWFILSDGIATISGTAILFARTELLLPTELVAVLSITVTAFGVLGAWIWPRIAIRYDLSSMQVVVRCVILLEIIPVYGLIGFLPFIKAWGVGGLQQQWEIFLLAVVMGIAMGGISSYCRSVYGVIVPPGLEAAFYSLYAVTDKGSSMIGPAIVGRIVDMTGNIRYCFWFLVILMIAPIPIFRMVNLESGREEAMVMAERWKNSPREDEA